MQNLTIYELYLLADALTAYLESVAASRLRHFTGDIHATLQKVNAEINSR